jgi:hypothetical protein
VKTSDISDADVVRAILVRDELATLGKAQTTEAILVQKTGAPLKVVRLAMRRAEQRKLLILGTSGDGTWITDEGLALAGLPPRPPTFLTDIFPQLR